MTPEQHQRMSLLFEEALKRLPEEREVYLNETCADDPVLRARVLTLLAHDRCASRDGFLAPRSTPLAMTAIFGEASNSASVETAESRMRYRTVRAHAKGGLGEVLLVHDEQLHRDVALKLIQRDHDQNPDSRRRFLVEAEVTAQLEHPGIVPVHSLAETSDGRPCYAMRFIQGESLQEAIGKFHASDKPGRDLSERSLALRQLLTQFITVCKTIAYAHSRGVLHRDIKPANIMLGKYGETLVVDWGLAKVTVSGPLSVASSQSPAARSEEPRVGEAMDYKLATATGDIVGTAAYMSPEQAWGDVLGPASDIYSLGATLYVILTGAAPIEGENALARAREGGFLAPRRRKKEVPLALERICLKAMALKPEGRYGDALELAADLEHWLADEPATAYREPWFGRLRRWGRRHRPLVAGLAAALVVGLVGLTAGLVVVTGLNRRLDASNAELKQANVHERQARERSDEVLKYFVDTFRRADPSQQGDKVTVVEVLNRTAQELPNKADVGPTTRGALLNAIGLTYLGLGFPRRAVEVLEQARSLHRQYLGLNEADTLTSMNMLAEAYRAAGQFADAISLLEETLRLRKEKLGVDHRDTLTTMNSLAAAYQAAGRLADAVPLLEETLKARKEKLGPDPQTLATMYELAAAYQAVGRLADAVPLFEETLRLTKAKLGPDHPDTLSTMNDLATAYQAVGQLADALLLFQENLRMRETKLGPEHPDTLNSMHSLAEGYQIAGRLTDALLLFEKTVKLREAKLGREHPATLNTMNNLAAVYRSVGRLADALSLHEETLKLQKAKLGVDHPCTLASMNNLAVCYWAAGRLPDAVPVLEETLGLYRSKLGPEHPATLQAMNNLGVMYQAAGRLADALGLWEDTLRLRKATLGSEHPDTIVTMGNVAAAYRASGRLAEALPLYEATLKLIRDKLGRGHPNTLTLMNNLAGAYRAADRLADALPLYKETLRLRRAKLGPDHPDTLTSMNNLASAYRRTDQLTEAVPLFEETLNLRRAKLGPEHWDTIDTMNNLALAYRDAGRIGDALPLFEEALKLRKAKLGPENPDTLTSMHNLASVYEHAGRMPEALLLYEKTLKLRKVKLGPQHARTVDTVYSLALLLKKQGSLAEAEPLFREVLSCREVLAAKPAVVSNTLLALGEILAEGGRPQEAEPLLRECVEISRNVQARGHGLAESALGHCLVLLGRYAEAERLLLTGYQTLKMAKSPPEILARAGGRIIRLYEAWDKRDKATEWRSKNGDGSD